MSTAPRVSLPEEPDRTFVGEAHARVRIHVLQDLAHVLALFQAIGALLLAWGAVDDSFVEEYATGFEGYREARRDLDWATVGAATGLARDEIEAAPVREVAATWSVGFDVVPVK